MKPPCECVFRNEAGKWVCHGCDCHNPGDLEEAAAWAADANREEEVARLKSQRDALLEVVDAALLYGLIPASSAKEGGASSHTVAARIADMARSAVAKVRGGEG